MTTREDSGTRQDAPRGIAGAFLNNAYLVLALGTLCWSGNHVFGRAFAGHVPPIGVACVRWIGAGFLLWLFARPHLKRDWPAIKAHVWILIFLSIIGGSIFGVLQFVALQYTTALNVSVINSITPVFIVGMVALLFRERLSGLQFVGIIVSLAGVLVIVTKADLHTLVAFAFNRGDLIILVNMAIWAIYSACLRLRPHIHLFSFMFVLAVVSFFANLPFFLWEHASGVRFHLDLLTVAAVVYVAIFPTVVAFLCWSRGVELIGPNRAGVFLHLVPLYTAIMSGLFLGEPLMMFHLVGFALILAGVWLTALRRA